MCFFKIKKTCYKGYISNGFMTTGMRTNSTDELYIDWISINSRMTFVKYKYGAYIDSGAGAVGPFLVTLTS